LCCTGVREDSWMVLRPRCVKVVQSCQVPSSAQGPAVCLCRWCCCPQQTAGRSRLQAHSHKQSSTSHCQQQQQ
jgi:hypothetical protein